MARLEIDAPDVVEQANYDNCLRDALYHQAGMELRWETLIAVGTDDSGLFYSIANSFGSVAKGATDGQEWEGRSFHKDGDLHIGFEACERCVVDGDLVRRVRELLGVGVPEEIGDAA